MSYFNDHQMILPQFLIFFPFLGLIINAFFYKKKPENAARLSTYILGIGLVCSIIFLCMFGGALHNTTLVGFKSDGLSLVMSALIIFVSFIVHLFSQRYMAGDRKYNHYFFKLSAITFSVIIMVFADNLAIFWTAWTCSNLMLVSLMIHKSEWLAAKYSGVLALKTLFSGSLALIASFFLMYHATGTISISEINANVAQIPSTFLMPIIVLLALSAFIQSAQWPFQRWLISSLNSPTPVSALMHAGLVNGGGFILVRFMPIFLSETSFLQLLFLIGSLTAILGTLWKLLQTDIKRMLANSTMAQMGFMMMQCGLGLFPAAVAHLCWHGLFKAYLFLNAGSALKAKKEKNKSSSISILVFLLSCMMGLTGALCFALISEKTVFSMAPTTFLVGFAFISGTQMAYSLISRGSVYKRLVPTLVLISLMGAFYGESIHLVESFFPAYSTNNLPSLTVMHLVIFALFFMLWLSMNLKNSLQLQNNKRWCQLYVRALNASQPHPSTITASRNTYQY